MAQIVTITNPLTGQPAQVDQLEHTAQEIDDAIARALPGGDIDIALQNKAPAGYGLGASSKNVTDWNNEKTNGWVRDPGGTENKHSPFVGLFSVGLISDYSSGKDAFQLAFARDQFKKTRTYIKFRAYNSDDKVWGEWEWVNPPMQLGVEYRTIERHNGGTVFAKAMTYTFTSYYDSASQFELEIPHGISNFGSLVRAEAVSPPYMIPYVSKNGGFAGVRSVNATNILFDSYKTSWNSGDKIMFKLFYTKS